jgi:hypothetical protein
LSPTAPSQLPTSFRPSAASSSMQPTTVQTSSAPPTISPTYSIATPQVFYASQVRYLANLIVY